MMLLPECPLLHLFSQQHLHKNYITIGSINFLLSVAVGVNQTWFCHDSRMQTSLQELRFTTEVTKVGERGFFCMGHSMWQSKSHHWSVPSLQVCHARGMLISSITSVSVTSMTLVPVPSWHKADSSVQSLVARLDCNRPHSASSSHAAIYLSGNYSSLKQR